jgi:hypothetical protein
VLLITYTGGLNVLKLWFKSINESLLSACIFFENENTHSEFDCLTYTGFPGIGTCPGVLCAFTNNCDLPNNDMAVMNNKSKIFIILIFL